jgi:hypothetical protein
MNRYVAIILEEEDVIRWERGFMILALHIARQMKLHRITRWPMLKRAEPYTDGRWKLLFVWHDVPTEPVR